MLLFFIKSVSLTFNSTSFLLHFQGQQSFVGEMSVGTPPQAMSVVVDIAGITLFPSVTCTDPFCTSHQQYDSSASSTYEVSCLLRE